MKRLRNIALLLLIVAFVFSFTSCTKKAETKATTTQTTASEPKVEVKSAPEPTPAPEPVKEPEPVVEKELTIEEKLQKDIWCFKYSAEGYGEFTYYFHFYENDPVLGNVYYAGMSNNRINFAGLYEVRELQYDYEVYLSREDAVAKTNLTPGSVPYSIILKDWDGNVMGRIGFDGEKVVNAQDKNTAKIYATGSTPYYYTKATPDWEATISGEMPVPFLEFVADEDVTSTIQINHNHTYTDLVAAMIEGKWVAENGENGGLKYVLTPYDKTDTPAVLEVSSDKLTAVYTAEGEDPIKMSIPQPAVTLVQAFEGTSPTSYGKNAPITIECMSDDTFTVTMAIFGNSQVIDQGKWSVNAAHKYTFNCDNAGTIESKIVDRKINVEYALAGTKLGDITSTLINK